jgi:hypothetical protein
LQESGAAVTSTAGTGRHGAAATVALPPRHLAAAHRGGRAAVGRAQTRDQAWVQACCFAAALGSHRTDRARAVKLVGAGLGPFFDLAFDPRWVA